jgi:hypothetical protein
MTDPDSSPVESEGRCAVCSRHVGHLTLHGPLVHLTDSGDYVYVPHRPRRAPATWACQLCGHDENEGMRCDSCRAHVVVATPPTGRPQPADPFEGLTVTSDEYDDAAFAAAEHVESERQLAADEAALYEQQHESGDDELCEDEL